MFRTIKKHEILLEQAITELCRILLRLGNRYMDAGLDEEVEISIDFDDSIIEDTASINQDMRLDVSAGIIKPELYIMRKYKVSEDEAKEMMPKMQDMTKEPEEEIE